jgi:hypothetical protein
MAAFPMRTRRAVQSYQDAVLTVSAPQPENWRRQSLLSHAKFSVASQPANHLGLRCRWHVLLLKPDDQAMWPAS